MSLQQHLESQIHVGKYRRWHDLHCNQKHSYQETVGGNEKVIKSSKKFEFIKKTYVLRSVLSGVAGVDQTSWDGGGTGRRDGKNGDEKFHFKL